MKQNVSIETECRKLALSCSLTWTNFLFGENFFLNTEANIMIFWGATLKSSVLGSIIGYTKSNDKKGK